MKQRAPLDWQHSSSDGVRTRSQGRPGVVSVGMGLCAGGGGLSGAVIPDGVTEALLLFQKPALDGVRNITLNTFKDQI